MTANLGDTSPLSARARLGRFLNKFQWERTKSCILELLDFKISTLASLLLKVWLRPWPVVLNL